MWQTDFGRVCTSYRKLRTETGVPASLKEYGIGQKLWNEKLDYITANALADSCTGTNPRKATLEDIKKIYQFTFDGEVVKF